MGWWPSVKVFTLAKVICGVHCQSRRPCDVGRGRVGDRILSIGRGVNCNVKSTTDRVVFSGMVLCVVFFCASVFNVPTKFIKAVFLITHTLSTVSSPYVKLLTSQAHSH